MMQERARLLMSPEQLDLGRMNRQISQINKDDEHLQSNNEIGELVQDLQIKPRPVNRQRDG